MTTTEPAPAPASVGFFPPGFLWGAATAAYQIEGAVADDGRTPSIWDTFSHTPGTTADGDTGDTATDHYHRMDADVALMASLGLRAYRFSVSWPRVLPHGGATPNPAGLDFYSRLVDRLLEHRIAPAVTLYHWDLPQELQDAGGWTNRDTAYRFADYAALVARRLGDRVRVWTTLNEPWCSAYLGYGNGVHAPGIVDRAAPFWAVHHLLLAHGLGVEAIRPEVLPNATTSITLNLANVRAASDSAADRDAARHVDGLTNRIFLDPLRHGRYPADVLADTVATTDWSFVRDGDLTLISTPIDALGINYYFPHVVRACGPDDPAVIPGSDRAALVDPTGDTTAMGWGIDADSFRELLEKVHHDHPDLPILVTENGAAFDDSVSEGSVHDDRRIAYLADHLAAVRTAMDHGVDVRGYFVWSLLDNFEWAYGYSKRFGIVHVDYETQERTVKDSGRWYRDLLANQPSPR